MRKIFLLASCLLCPFALGAQAVYPVTASSDNAVAAPASNIDLLKQSLGSSGVASSASSSSAAAAPAAPASAAPQAASAAPAQSPAKAAAQPAPSRTRTSSAVLEMPLATGGVVKTQVAAPKASSRAKAASRARKPAPKAAAKPISKPAAQPTPTEQEIEKNNALAEGERSGTPRPAEQPTAQEPQTDSASQADAMAQEELDYAARMLERQRQESTGSRFIPPAAEKSAPVAPVAANRPYNPNDFRPGVQWQRSDSTHFIIYTQKRDGGIGSSNLSMAFESAYATLRRNIPWMMSGKVRVFVYQDHNSYLKHEPNAKAWTRALAYPTRGEVVVYDEPGKQQSLKEVFTHELVHVFTQQFFDKYKTGRLMTPAWLDEGLAVYMEDQAYNGLKGGPWAQDFKTLNFQRSKQTQVAQFGSSSMFGSSRTMSPSGNRRRGKPLYFMPFEEFMQEGSLAFMEGRGKTQDWYFQAYSMVRFLLNPAGGSSPSNRMQFEQFTRLMAQGEQVRDPRTGFPARDSRGKPVYQPYSAEKALGRAYRYNSAANMEDAFWRWANSAR